MTKEMENAINYVMKMVKPWELSQDEQNNLQLAQSGDEGALCDLLTSQGLQNKEEFYEFYQSIND